MTVSYSLLFPGMRASVHIDLPGWTKLGPKVLAARCEELHLQPRGTRGESGGQTGESLYSSLSGNSYQTSPSGVILLVDCLFRTRCSFSIFCPPDNIVFPRLRCFVFRYNLRHLQQASVGILWGAARAEDDRWSQHSLQGRHCFKEGSWHLMLYIMFYVV